MKEIIHPKLGVIKYPDSITISMPENGISELSYIPWKERKYGKKIPKEYRDIWEKALPHLRVRTTDVHTAVSLDYLYRTLLPQFEREIGESLDWRISCFGIILHDCGWSKLTPEQISWSFQDIKGSLGWTGKAKIAKKLHCARGLKLAAEILEKFSLSMEQKEKIFQIVRYHEFPEELKERFLGFNLVLDADKIWSFTAESFWLDVIRKGIAPKTNLTNLEKERERYFLTEFGRTFSKSLLQERAKEIKKLYPETEEAT